MKVYWRCPRTATWTNELPGWITSSSSPSLLDTSSKLEPLESQNFVKPIFLRRLGEPGKARADFYSKIQTSNSTFVRSFDDSVENQVDSSCCAASAQISLVSLKSKQQFYTFTYGYFPIKCFLFLSFIHFFIHFFLYIFFFYFSTIKYCKNICRIIVVQAWTLILNFYSLQKFNQSRLRIPIPSKFQFRTAHNSRVIKKQCYS